MTTDLAPSQRDTSAVSQLQRLISLNFVRQWKSKKFKILFTIGLLPVIFIIFAQLTNGLSEARLNVIKWMLTTFILPLFVPLVSFFFSASIISEELEKKTITYLTLRPISRPMIFIGKWASSTLAAAMVSIVTYVILTVIAFVMIPTPDDATLRDSISLIVPGFAAIAIGTVSLCTIFATLGTIFRSGVIASLIYYIFIELLFSHLPLISLLSVTRYYVSIIVGAKAPMIEFFENFIQVSTPLLYIIPMCMTLLWLAVGIAVFNRRTYVI